MTPADTGAETRAATEAWFLAHGLPYFVPEEQAAARSALRPRRLLPLLLLTVVLAGAGGFAVAWLAGQASAAPAVLVTAGLLAGAAYAVTALRARPILSWAATRTVSSLRHALRMASRALPLLLLFVTFLFINAEAWELAGTMAPGVLWLVVVLLAALAVVFLVVRLPEEVDRADDAVDDAFLLRACAGTPLEETCRRLVADRGVDPAAYAVVTGPARLNLVLALVVIQAAQVLLLVLSVLVFFLVFGSLTMTDAVQLGWTGQEEGDLGNLPYLTNVSVELFQVSLFLAAFSGLYFTVSALTDDAYRSQFLSDVTRHLEQAVGTRAVYLAAFGTQPGERPAP
ncbi:hypothetical protein [Nocardioides perillae]|uniref:Integral membrane protein n=1 Tax=Nocardioides perillae TaxID=1119534 RepID=A0A7Y9RYM6_9ACTN|nr:hypothetical protein [Nocardioides perillae]NYG56345.1 hypothetical protein [Nocardioides perillae]